MVWLIIVLALALIIGNALVLLRTAKKPQASKEVRPQPYDDEGSGW